MEADAKEEAAQECKLLVFPSSFKYDSHEASYLNDLSVVVVFNIPPVVCRLIPLLLPMPLCQWAGAGRTSSLASTQTGRPLFG